ncbi:MAG TPA: gliding motility-associated C-terminal domain-containing protein, partial [Saprospiraceae bacterium]|nr:gliding motility-associated C-terminal domain-containing protein [Saprospiraceae bacterium]
KNGCTATDSITVFILSPDIVYIPNVFSPDGDGINDRVTVYAGNRVKAIRIFEIFDRWGEKVFSRTDMPANEPEAGWDGKHRGQKVQEGVYVYYLLIELTDGKKRLLKGDISLIQ